MTATPETNASGWEQTVRELMKKLMLENMKDAEMAERSRITRIVEGMKVENEPPFDVYKRGWNASLSDILAAINKEV